MSGAGFSWPWERMAMHGEEMPDGLRLPDQEAYTSMRNVYYLYRQKVLSRDQASAEKRQIRREWKLSKDAAEFASKTAEFRSRQLKLTELAKTVCRKNPTPENALRLCDVLDGIEGEAGHDN